MDMNKSMRTMRMRTMRTSIATLGLVLLAQAGMADGNTLAAKPEAKPFAYDPMVFGTFIEHFHRQTYGGIFEPGSKFADADGFRTDVIEALKAIKTPIVRWPGGCFASAYHWKFGVGKRREPVFDKAWGVEEPNTFGTDEFVKWCRKVGCEPYICLNAGTGTPEEMSEWAEYCNATVGPFARMRAENGHSEPYGVKFWSIGAEQWGPWHETGAKTVEEWGPYVRESSKMLLRVDHTLKLFAPATQSDKWNAPLLKAAGRYLDYMSVHIYGDRIYKDYRPSPYLKVIGFASRMENLIGAVRNSIEKSGYANRMKIAVDEWNPRGWHHPGIDEFHRGFDLPVRDKNDTASTYTMADAVYTATCLNTFLRNGDIVTLACYSPAVNTTGLVFTHPNGIVKRTTYHVFWLYANRLLPRTLASDLSCGTLALEKGSVPVLDAVVTTDEKRTRFAIAAVNKDPARAQSLRIDFASLGMAAAPASVEAEILAGDSPDAYNDIGAENRVVPVKATLQVVDGAVELPPHSVCVISVRADTASAKADRLLAEPIPDCPDSLYMEYFENGNRSHYEKRLFGRLGLIQRLAAAERKERRGRYTARLAEVIGVVCSMKSWSLPAHDKSPDCVCLKGITPVVELVSSRIAKELMDIVTDPQLALPAETVRTVRAEAERRILAPYLAYIRGGLKADNWFWFWVKCANNWNAVCHANVVRTALKRYPFGDTNRAEIVSSAVSRMPKFLGGFTDDGYCSEGAGYWNYGFGHFIELADALRTAPEKIDLCASEKAKTVARYGFRYWLSQKTSPRFADGSGVPRKDLLDQCAAIWPDLRREPLALRDTFDVAQVYLFRPASGKGALAVGFKGGHNGEFHNHNDLGSYNIALGDLIVCGDPGGEVYTRRTFSPQRYVSKVLNSYAHPVPRVAGKLQGTGRKFAAKEVGRAFSPDRDTVTLDLAGGYDCPALKSLTRTFAYDRAADSLTITDRVEFGEPSDFDDPVVTHGTFADATAAGFTIEQDGRRLAVDVRVTGADAAWSEETVENPGRASPRLRTLRLKNVTRAEVEFTFRASPSGANTANVRQ